MPSKYERLQVTRKLPYAICHSVVAGLKTENLYVLEWHGIEFSPLNIVRQAMEDIWMRGN
jgi:hypothetical protein